MASLSKREQARNERELQDLLRQPGNSTCADCVARNPAWASWNLGIFLCMRCASIHRKLGTHVSKVKSLSMDKWTADQIESMKANGNVASNNIYNPKNKKPDIPLDADEVDSAMERFIRKKYQEKSLAHGRPEPPSRAGVSRSNTRDPPQPAPSMELPAQSKKHKFFGFSLRTSSKKDRSGVDNAFNITPVEYSPTSGNTREVSDTELQQKLAQLRDMGFSRNNTNLNVLKRTGGDLERTIATLVQMGADEPLRKESGSSASIGQSASAAASTTALPPTDTASNNPWEVKRPQPQGGQSSGFGLSFDAPQQQAPPRQQPQSQPQPAAPNANPWQSAMPSYQPTGLEQQFSGMQVSNPLFPHHTGGYGQSAPYQQDHRFQTMTPPVPSIPQQYGYTASPTSTSNPFFQQSQPMSSQSTGNNPFLQQQQSQPVFAPQANPFLGMQPTYSQSAQSTGSNPFGLPSTQQSYNQQNTGMSQPQTQEQSGNPFGFPPQASPPPVQQSQTFSYTQQSQANPFGQQLQQSQQPQFSQSQFQQPQSPQPQIPNFDYGQPSQVQQTQQPQAQYQQSTQQQAFYQNQQFSARQSQPQPQAQHLQPQQTGRYTKTDILSLFNHPTSSQQQQPLASVQESSDIPQQQQSQTQQQQQQQQQQQYFSPTPSNNPYGNTNLNTGKRSATMPATMSSIGTGPSSGMSTMHSSGGAGSRNPFMAQSQSQPQQNTPVSSVSSNPFGQHQQQGQFPGQLQVQGANASWQGGVRHASNESVSVNNPGLMDGRHSPDAFASLSSRY